jgi:hypothetical protein
MITCEVDSLDEYWKVSEKSSGEMFRVKINPPKDFAWGKKFISSTLQALLAC